MTRRATPRPAQEHHAHISRIFRQVGCDKKMKEPRRQKILQLLEDLLRELQAEMAK